jgi:ATP synthase F1 epsilon subunit
VIQGVLILVLKKNYIFFMRFQVIILTPDRIFKNEEAEELLLPTSTGQIGVLTGHAPLITAIDIGPRLVRQGSNWISLALMGGFALVQETQVTILVNEAIIASSVDEKEAEIDLKKAREQLQQVIGRKEKVEATFAFKRSRALYQIVTWKQK